jgi:prolyl-tRNA synthetase
VPLRAEVGPKDIAKNAIFLGRRDTGEKQGIGRDEFVATVSSLLTDIQDRLFSRAKLLRDENTRDVDNVDEFKAYFTPRDPERPEIHGGFANCYFVETPEVEELLKQLKVTIRCVPLGQDQATGKCIFTGRPTTQRGLFAKAY